MEALFSVELTGPEIEALVEVAGETSVRLKWFREDLMSAYSKLCEALTIVESAGC